jgi:hypothetical protein
VVAKRLLPAGCGLLLALSIAMPVHTRHHASTGHLLPTGYDALKIDTLDPIWRRRSFGFYAAPCITELVERPYYPSCSSPDARFWPVLVATTFGDYYNFRYAGMPEGAEPSIDVNARQLSLRALGLMRASVVAGALIAIATAFGVLAGVAAALRRRDVARSVLLAAAILAIVGQLAFTIQFPYDAYGPIKGAYLQFASAPLFAAFGGACSFLWRRPKLRAFAVLQIAALLVVCGYSVYARWHGFS